LKNEYELMDWIVHLEVAISNVRCCFFHGDFHELSQLLMTVYLQAATTTTVFGEFDKRDITPVPSPPVLRRRSESSPDESSATNLAATPNTNPIKKSKTFSAKGMCAVVALEWNP
jgi:hypothetical protein